MLKKSSIILFVLTLAFSLEAQIYVSGNGTGKEIYVDGASGSTYTLFVDGYIHNNGGEIVNDGGEIELTGDWTNTPAGAITYAYESTGTERFSGSATQRIMGTMNGTVSNYNQFYNLRIDKSSSGQYVELQTDVNINTAGSIVFESNGILRTDILSHGDDGSAYAYEIYLRNPSTSSLSGYATTGANNYIEGKLLRQVSGSGTYYFPIGIQPGTLDSEEPFQITTVSATSSNVLGYLQPGTTTYIGDDIFCDAGTDPSPTSGTPITSNPGSPADGILDLLDITCEYSVEWVVQPSLAGYTYTFTGIPGTVLQSECTYYTGMTAVGELKWTGKDGLPNNVSATSPAPFYTSGYETCPNIYTITGITGAAASSVYRTLGVDDPSTSILPVELAEFTGFVLSTGNELSWTTLSETGIALFELQSSADNKNFSTIYATAGAGTSTTAKTYNYLDLNPKAHTTYYRLKTIDIDGKVESSNVIALTRDVYSNLAVYPNPVVSNLHCTYYAMQNESVTIRIISASGNTVILKTMQVQQGYNTFTLDGTSLRPGLYILELHNGYDVQQVGFIKQ